MPACLLDYLPLAFIDHNLHVVSTLRPLQAYLFCRTFRVFSARSCWFVAAVATCAVHPELIERLLITKKLTKKSVYCFRFAFNGEFQPIYVDSKAMFYKPGYVPKPLLLKSRPPGTAHPVLY